MSLIFPNGSRTVTTTPWESPFGAQAYGMPGPQSPRQNQPQQQVFGNSSMGPVQTGGPNTQQGQGAPSGGMDMSAYSPGRARPIPSPSQGTPFQAYNQQQPGGMTPQAGQGFPQSQMPPVTQAATGVNGQRFSDPGQAFAQRDALIQRINEARAPMFAGAGTYLGEGAPPPTWGQKPPLDFGSLMGQANDMVAGGWQNPFASRNFGEPQYQIGVPGGRLPPGGTGGGLQPPRREPQTGGFLAPPEPPAFREPPIPQVIGTTDFSGNAYEPGSQYQSGGPSMPATGARPTQRPGYGTPAEQRGAVRTSQWIDRDRDGVDDRDQDGPGMSRYAPASPPVSWGDPGSVQRYLRAQRQPGGQLARGTRRYYTDRVSA